MTEKDVQKKELDTNTQEKEALVADLVERWQAATTEWREAIPEDTVLTGEDATYLLISALMTQAANGMVRLEWLGALSPEVTAHLFATGCAEIRAAGPPPELGALAAGLNGDTTTH